MSATAQLLEAVRKEARPGIWTTGVTLSRNGAVSLQSQKPTELELRVKAPGRPLALTVTLYPNDAVWECDCPGRVDPCQHVGAAAIFVQQAEKQDTPLETVTKEWSRVVYHFTRVSGGL